MTESLGKSLRDAYVGVDVSFAKRKPLPVAVCSWQHGRLVPYALRELSIAPPRGGGNAAALDEAVVRAFASEAAEYLTAVSKELDLSIVRIGIDAPSSPCRSRVRRVAEQALDRAGISCFATPTESEFESIKAKARAHLAAGGAESRMPHANQLWMLVGFALFRQLSNVAECIEVFPQATVRALGVGDRHKSAPGAVAAQADAVAHHTGWPKGGDGPNLGAIARARLHDCLDAYMSAWVAALDEAERVPMGAPPDDVIWIPKIGKVERRETVAARPASEETGRTMVCPACKEKQFKRWPWGWDAHAAFKCSGLSRQGPEQRKEEFRNRFGALFAG